MNRRRDLLLASASVLALSIASGGGAFADGYEPAGKGFAAPPAVTRWGGFYLGAHVGWGRANMDGFLSVRESGRSTEVADFDGLDADGILGGVHGGFNWQRGRTVFGIEGDWDFMDWDDDAQAVIVISESGTAITHGELDNLASVRAKIGVTVGSDQRALLFLTGGVAWADVSGRVCGALSCSGSTQAKFDFDTVGGVVGGGVEYAMTDRFRIRVDGSYYWFDDTKTQTFVSASDEVKTFRFDFDDVYTFRVGGTFYFTRPRAAPVALK